MNINHLINLIRYNGLKIENSRLHKTQDVSRNSSKLNIKI